MDLTELKLLEERYPFNEEELEVLLRGHRAIVDPTNEDSFITKLALCSPYSFFFLPDDEMRNRAEYIETRILPMGFDSQFRAAVSADTFVSYANQNQDLPFERFLEGIADAGRRGPKEASSILYDIIPDPSPQEIIELTYCLSIAAQVFVKPMVNKTVVANMLEHTSQACEPLVRSLTEACEGKGLTKEVFVRWADHTAPMLSSTLSTFVHNMLFHGRPYPISRVPYAPPMLDHVSDIFAGQDISLLFPLSVASNYFNGKMHRLYSANQDGRSFNRLEWSLLGYSGPSLILIKTDQDAVLGAFAALPWKDAIHFQGDSACFLFQLSPTLHLFLPTGRDENFVYCHSESFDGTLPDGHAHGLGFGGTIEHPRLFIPESLEECSAAFFDGTFQQGELLPADSFEKFQINELEVWGVGGDEAIRKGMHDRAERREMTDTVIRRSQVVMDKSQFAKDFKSGLIPNKVFQHRSEARGRKEYAVDENHGGYKIDIEDKVEIDEDSKPVERD
jgi:hypothetical protein